MSLPCICELDSHFDIRNVSDRIFTPPFEIGESLGEVKLHYRTIGTLQRDATGRARNAVLILHGTGGAGTNFLSAQFGGVLFGPGQLLDATKYFIVLPDNVGHG